MTERAEQIWKAFCGELTQEPTDDMREALTTAVREVIVQLGYFKYDADGIHGNTIVNVRDILVLCEELESREWDV